MMPPATSRTAHKRTASELTGDSGGNDGSSDGFKGARGHNKGKAPSDFHSRSHNGSVAFLGSGRGVRHSVTGPQCPLPATRGEGGCTRSDSSSSSTQPHAPFNSQSSRMPDVHALLQPPSLSGTVCRVAEPPNHTLLGTSFEDPVHSTYASGQKYGSTTGGNGSSTNGNTGPASKGSGSNLAKTSGGATGKRGRGTSGPATKGRPASAATPTAKGSGNHSRGHSNNSGAGGGGGRGNSISSHWGAPSGGNGNNSDDQSGGSDDDDDDDLPLPPPGSASTLEEQRELQLLHR